MHPEDRASFRNEKSRAVRMCILQYKCSIACIIVFFLVIELLLSFGGELLFVLKDEETSNKIFKMFLFRNCSRKIEKD